MTGVNLKFQLRSCGATGLVFVCLLAVASGASAIAQSASSADLSQRYAQQGSEALAAGKLAEAEQAFVKLRGLQSGVAEVHANLGAVYFQEGKLEEASASLRQALKLKPGLAASDALLAIVLSELGQFKQALPGLEKCFHHGATPDTKRTCGLQLERAYTGLDRHGDAVQTALELNKAFPDDPEVLYHNGKIFGNFAFLSIQRLATAAPASIWRHLAEAEANESQGENDSAISEYRQVLALDSNRPGIHYRLGRTLLSRSRQSASPDDIEQARAEFQHELGIDPSNANAAYELGEIHRNASEMPEAQRYFEQALAHYPDFEQAQLGLAAVLISRSQPADALPHLQRALTLNRDNEVTWYRLSQVQGVLGNAGEQKGAFAEFQKLRDAKSKREEAGKQIFAPQEVTPQQLEKDPPR